MNCRHDIIFHFHVTTLISYDLVDKIKYRTLGESKRKVLFAKFNEFYIFINSVLVETDG